MNYLMNETCIRDRVPTPQQYAWQQMELTAFLHFGINTFTGRDVYKRQPNTW